jgi:hypothetical protein
VSAAPTAASAASAASARLRADEDALLQCLAVALGDGAPAVTGVRRERSAFASSYDAEVVTVGLAGGGELTLFLKNFGASEFPKDEPARRRDRERTVYRELLADAKLGTASYYGSVWDEAGGRFWLLLEFVRGPELRSCALEYWLMAAAWLGRMHGHFAPLDARLRASDCLLRHDAEFFRAKAECAAREVREVSAPLAERFAKLMPRYERAAAVMTRQPRTLVHGHFRPCNVLVAAPAAGADAPARICPVDWEQAAVGSAAYDLALLTDGFAPPELDQLLEAYRAEALAHGLAVPGREELRQVVECVRLFMDVKLLSRVRERGFSERKVAETVARLEQRARAMEALAADA